jgi:hypothetical protein
MADDVSTEKIRRNDIGNLVKTWLPAPVVVWLLITGAPMVWWIANQSRDIQDARRIADEAKAELAACRAEDKRLHDQVQLGQISQREIVTRLAGIEAQIAEVRAILLRGLR